MLAHELDQSVPAAALTAAELSSGGEPESKEEGDGNSLVVVPVTRLVLAGGIESMRGAFSARTVPAPARVGPGEADPNVWVLDLPPCDLLRMKEHNASMDRKTLREVTPETAPSEGRARCTYPDGAVYEGDFFQNQRYGSGRCTWPGGDSYDGQWVGGAPQGTGTATYSSPSGDVVYVGEWIRGVHHGRGRLTRSPGDVDPKWTPELLGALIDEVGVGSSERLADIVDDLHGLLDPLKRMYGGCLGSSCEATLSGAREWRASGAVPTDVLAKTAVEVPSLRPPIQLSAPWIAYEESRSPVLGNDIRPNDLCPSWVEAGPPVTSTTQALIPDARALVDTAAAQLISGMAGRPHPRESGEQRPRIEIGSRLGSAVTEAGGESPFDGYGNIG